MTIEQALKEVPGIERVDVSVDNKVVKVDGDVDKLAVIEQIEKAGYSVKR
jgi:copper chaperone CopZ